MVDLKELAAFADAITGERIFYPSPEGNVPLSKATLQEAIATMVEQEERIVLLEEEIAERPAGSEVAATIANRLIDFIADLASSERKRFEKTEILNQLEELVEVEAAGHSRAAIDMVKESMRELGFEITDDQAVVHLDRLVAFADEDEDSGEPAPPNGQVIVFEPSTAVDEPVDDERKPLQPGASPDEPGADGESANEARNRFLAAVESGQLKPVGAIPPVEPEQVLAGVERDGAGRISTAL